MVQLMTAEVSVKSADCHVSHSVIVQICDYDIGLVEWIFHL